MWLCAESIYRAIYQPNSTLTRPPIVRPPPRSPLRTDRDHRRAQMRTGQRRKRFNAAMLSVHDRPFDPVDRGEPGHWEGDLIVGPADRSVIGTLVERQTRVVNLIHLERADSLSLHRALDVTGLPPHVLRSITWDQGTRDGSAREDRGRPQREGLLLRPVLAVAATEQRERLLVQDGWAGSAFDGSRPGAGRRVTRRTRADRLSVDLSTAARWARALTGSDLIEAC